MRRQLRALRRSLVGIAALPLIVSAVALQGLIVGPILRNRTAIPNMMYNGMRRLFGIRLEFNEKSAKIEKDKPTWFVVNHMSMADFMVAGSALNGTFVGKGDILKWPVVAQMAQAVKYIGIKRTREFNPENRGMIAQNFNKGNSTIMFPEGTTNDGSRVDMFRAGLIGLLFGEEAVDKKGNPVELEKEVVVQPIAVRVKSVEGKDARDSDELRNYYSHFEEENTLKRIWKRFTTKEIVLEITPFPTLDPKDYKDQFELINTAHENVRSVVAPNQKTVEKGQIPSQTKQVAAQPIEQVTSPS